MFVVTGFWIEIQTNRSYLLKSFLVFCDKKHDVELQERNSVNNLPYVCLIQMVFHLVAKSFLIRNLLIKWQKMKMGDDFEYEVES